MHERHRKNVNWHLVSLKQLSKKNPSSYCKVSADRIMGGNSLRTLVIAHLSSKYSTARTQEKDYNRTFLLENDRTLCLAHLTWFNLQRQIVSESILFSQRLLFMILFGRGTSLLRGWLLHGFVCKSLYAEWHIAMEKTLQRNGEPQLEIVVFRRLTSIEKTNSKINLLLPFETNQCLETN